VRRARCQVRSNTAGSIIRLNKSLNRRSRSAFAHRCCVILGGGHGAPVLTSGHLAFQSFGCEHAATLGRVVGFRPRTTTAATISHGGPARVRPGWPVSRAVVGWFPRSMLPVRRDRALALPWRPRHDDPQHFTVAFSSASPGPHRSDADSNAIACAPLTGPHPSGSSRPAQMTTIELVKLGGRRR
jgi:hypothetical protein